MANRLLHILLGICLCMGSCEKPSFPEEDDKVSGGGTIEKPSEPNDGEDENTFSCLTVAQAWDWCYSLSSDTAVWVMGYIVGYIPGSSVKQIQFGIPSDVETNIVLADRPDETDYMNCLPVRLEKGKAIREELNLVAHPENFHRRIAVAGLVEEYFRIPGIRKPLAYEWIKRDSVSQQLPFPSLDDEEVLISGGRVLK